MPDKDKIYFNDYATLVQQQAMLQDHVRTSLYQFSMLENPVDFKGKTVVDVGAGTGILSFFAAKAGASKVYAVEASGMALHAKTLAAGNGLADVIEVINKRVEDVQLPERVDVLISEPLGIALVVRVAPWNPEHQRHPAGSPASKYMATLDCSPAACPCSLGLRALLCDSLPRMRECSSRTCTHATTC